MGRTPLAIDFELLAAPLRRLSPVELLELCETNSAIVADQGASNDHCLIAGLLIEAAVSMPQRDPAATMRAHVHRSVVRDERSAVDALEHEALRTMAAARAERRRWRAGAGLARGLVADERMPRLQRRLVGRLLPMLDELATGRDPESTALLASNRCAN
jgi:streptomycin 6-kinase